MELQPIHKLKQILETNETPEEEEFNREWIKLTMLVDYGPWELRVSNKLWISTQP